MIVEVISRYAMLILIFIAEKRALSGRHLSPYFTRSPPFTRRLSTRRHQYGTVSLIISQLF